MGDVEPLRALQRPWSVPSIACAVVADLLETARLAEWVQAIGAVRAAMVAAAPWPADPGVAPYVTFRVGDAAAAQAHLLSQHRVLVRDCASFGLPDRIRVAVHPEVPWLR